MVNQMIAITALTISISAIVLTAGIGVFMIINDSGSITQSDVVDIVQDNAPVIPDYTPLLCHKDTSCVEWLNKNYAFKGDVPDNNKELEDITREISSIRIEMASVSAQLAKQKNTPIPTQSTACLSTTMELNTSSSDPSDIRSTFTRGDIIYITGETEPSSSNKIKIINKSTDQVIEESSFNASSKGIFTRAHISDTESDKGEYTVQIERGATKSCIGFTLQ